MSFDDAIREFVRDEVERVLAERPALPAVPAAGGKEYLSTAEVAEAYGVAAVTLKVWRANADGPPHYKAGRRVMYKRVEVDAWFSDRRRGRL